MKKNPIFVYLVTQTILFQILGIIALSKYNSPELRHLFIYMDIAMFLSLLLFFTTKILEKKHKIIDFIFVPSIVFFVIYSIYPFFR